MERRKGFLLKIEDGRITKNIIIKNAIYGRVFGALLSSFVLSGTPLFKNVF